MPRIVCQWCQTVNDAVEKNCVACGAPIEVSLKAQRQQKTKSTPVAVVKPDSTTQEIKKAGEETEKIYNAAMSAYSLAWRTAAEVLAVALSAFLLGLAGGGIRLAWLGVLGGLGVGLAIGLVQKSFWLVLLGAPLGVLAGAVLGLLPWAIGLGPAGMVLCAIGLGVAGALLGRRKVYNPNVYERLRPLLGALGGLGFAGLGALLGTGLAWVVESVSAYFNGL